MKEYWKLPEEEKELLVRKAADVAHQTESLYGNCVQSVLNGLYEAFPDMTCGALSGAAFAISLFYGRPIDDFAGYYDDCQALIRTVMDAFEEKYGGVLCHEVLTRNLGAPYDWKTEDGFKEYNDHDGTPHDAEVVAFCTEMVARMLVDGKLQYGEDLRPDVENPYYKSPNTLKKIAAREERIRARKQQ